MLWASSARAADTAVHYGPRPTWVAPADDDVAAPSDGAVPTPNGRRYRLLDRQVRIDRGRAEDYRRTVVEVVNESGLGDAAQIVVTFDPSYESLTLHSVVIHRAGQALPRLDRAAVKLVEREPNLEQQIYDGRKSAVLFVHDLRVHDVIEYEYTTRGADPTLGSSYAGSFVLGGPEPVAHLRARILTPRAQPLEITQHRPSDDTPSLSPRTSEQGPLLEYSWDLRDTKAYPIEASVPGSVDVLPWVQLSQLTSWGQVAAWGAHLFRADGADADPGIRAWVAEAGKEAPGQEDYVLRALRFVQDEVRYVGVEVGLGRRKPASPGAVLARRFGDCKDKSALLVALLRVGGVSATPALVSTTARASVVRWGPSPAAFDHAIVQVKLGDRVYWLDPTTTLEGGTLARYQRSWLGAALLLDEGTVDIEAVLDDANVAASPDIHDRFRIADPLSGDGVTKLETERAYTGRLADAMRAVFRAETIEQTGRNLLKRYEQDYPDVVQERPVERFDDRDENRVRVVARFAIPKLWKWQEEQRRHVATFTPRLIADALERPATAGRTHPLDLPFPFREAYRMEVDLPFDLPLAPDVQTVRSPTFDFHFRSNLDGRRLTYTYELSTRATMVQVSSLQEHVDAIDRAVPLLQRSLLVRPEGPPGPNKGGVAVVVLVALLGAWGAWRWSRYEPKKLVDAARIPLTPELQQLAGYRGLLAVVGLLVIVHPIATTWTIVKNAPGSLSARTWEALTTPALPTYNPALAGLALAELALNAILVAYSIAIATLFFTRRIGFRFHYVAALWASLAFSVADIAALAVLHPDTSTNMAEAIGRIFGALLWTVIFTAYIRDSRRVKATFTRSFAEVAPVDEPAEVTPPEPSTG